MHMARSVNRVHRKSADRVHLVHPSSPPPPQHQLLFLCTHHFFPSVRGRPCWYEHNHGHGCTEKRASPSVRVGMNVAYALYFWPWLCVCDPLWVYLCCLSVYLSGCLFPLSLNVISFHLVFLHLSRCFSIFMSFSLYVSLVSLYNCLCSYQSYVTASVHVWVNLHFCIYKSECVYYMCLHMNEVGCDYGLRQSSLIMGVHPGCPVCLIVAASFVAVETDVFAHEWGWMYMHT